MQKLFLDTRILDSTVRERYALTEEIMMENAASALEKAVKEALGCDGTAGAVSGTLGAESGAGGALPVLAGNAGGAVLVLCGSGNNGADGYALARRLYGQVEVCVISCGSPKSQLCKAQAKRAKKTGVPVAANGQKLKKKKTDGNVLAAAGVVNGTDGVFGATDGTTFALAGVASVIVDCVFGSGFHGELDEDIRTLLDFVNGISNAESVLNGAAGGGNESDGDAHRASQQVRRAAGAVKIACDVPTGLRADGTAATGAFHADITVTMGALKSCLYSDEAKDVAGVVECAGLGVSRYRFENAGFTDSGEFRGVQEGARSGKGGVDGEVRGIGLVAAAGELREKMAAVSPNAMLLEKNDLQLPVRAKNLVNKGTYGHASIVCGEKCGAACIASEAALQFGSGLVTLVHLGSGVDKNELHTIPAAIMTGGNFPANTTAVALGMGLGRSATEAVPYFSWLSDASHVHIPALLDADVFYSPLLHDFLTERCRSAQEKGSSPLLVLTPHPKEFQSLLSICSLGNYSVSDCVNQRLNLTEQFCRAYPGVVLLVKGANPVIAVAEGGRVQRFINPLGTPALAKAGSGDVLSGLICSLLAQGRNPLDAALNASLAHALASQKVSQNYALTPSSLIQNIGEL